MERVYSNRELSTLDFQDRVLSLAENPNLPLMERVKFVAITSSNLDEFHQVRVAGLREQKAAGIVAGGPDGMTPSEQLNAIRQRCESLLERIERVFHNELLPALEEAGIRIVSWVDIDAAARKSLGEVFVLGRILRQPLHYQLDKHYDRCQGII